MANGAKDVYAYISQACCPAAATARITRLQAEEL